MLMKKIPVTLSGRLFRIICYSLAPAAMGFIGLYGGVRLDRITGMTPNFTIVCLVTGLALGYLGFVREIKGEMTA
jgi:F0F1-type ATP synthase assembly protein I